MDVSCGGSSTKERTKSNNGCFKVFNFMLMSSYLIGAILSVFLKSVSTMTSHDLKKKLIIFSYQSKDKHPTC